jgi:peptide/nickel transport system permease protein
VAGEVTGAETARWLGQRLALGLLVVLGAVTAAFVAFRFMPGNPVRVLLGAATPTQAQLNQLSAQLGYDKPAVVQFGDYLWQLLHGNLGYSYQEQQPVAELIGSQLAATVELAACALVLALGGAVLLAVATAGRWPFARAVSSFLELVAISAPSFWVGVLLLEVFSFRLRLLPAIGSSGLNALVLPAVTLALSVIGVFAQVLRTGMEQALGEPFVLSSRARGTGQTAIRLRHALPHALVPLITLTGWTLGQLLSGAVIIETVFSRQGLGRVLDTAIVGRDLPVIEGVTVVSAVAFALASIGVDWLSRAVDPRLRLVAV